MKLEYAVVGFIILIAIGVGVYFFMTPASDDSLTPPALPDEGGMSADALRVLANPDPSVGLPPRIPIG